MNTSLTGTMPMEIECNKIVFLEEFERAIVSMIRGKAEKESLFKIPQIIRVTQPGRKTKGRFLRFKFISEDLGVGTFFVEKRFLCEDGYVDVDGRVYVFKKHWDIPVQIAQYSEKVLRRVLSENFFIFSLRGLEQNKIDLVQYSRGSFIEGSIEFPD